MRSLHRRASRPVALGFPFVTCEKSKLVPCFNIHKWPRIRLSRRTPVDQILMAYHYYNIASVTIETVLLYSNFIMYKALAIV